MHDFDERLAERRVTKIPNLTTIRLRLEEVVNERNEATTPTAHAYHRGRVNFAAQLLEYFR